jgi:hypothetical protein
VTVHFACADDLSGIASCPADATLATDGTGLAVAGTAVDAAGNSAGATVDGISIDTTAPTIVAVVSPEDPDGSNGWYRGPVTVSYVCTDALSGVDVCPAAVVLGTDGADQGASGTATDKAGNSASAGAAGIDIDQTSPAYAAFADLTVDATSQAGAAVKYPATYTATDSTSGIAYQGCSKASGATFPIGTTAVTCTETDAAGNQANASFTVTVLRASGQIGALVSKVQGLPIDPGFKAGLLAKLRAAQASFEAGATRDVCNQFGAFLNQVKAGMRLRNMQLSFAQANALVADVARIRALTGC